MKTQNSDLTIGAVVDRQIRRMFPAWLWAVLLVSAVGLPWAAYAGLTGAAHATGPGGPLWLAAGVAAAAGGLWLAREGWRFWLEVNTFLYCYVIGFDAAVREGMIK